MTSGMSPVGIYLIKKILYIKLDIFKFKNFIINLSRQKLLYKINIYENFLNKFFQF